MKRMFATLAAGALLVAATPPAPTDATAAPPAVKPATDPGQKKICHEVVEIGTRLGSTRVCHTAKEEQEAQINRRQFVEEVQRGFSRCNVPDPSKC